MNTSKKACSKEPFTLDWSDFFELVGLDPQIDTISSSVWAVTGGAVSDLEGVNGPKTTILLSGGTKGTPATITNTIELSGGTYKDCRTIHLTIT